MLKRLLGVVALLCAALPSCAQSVRYDSEVTTVQKNVPYGSQAPLLAVVFAKVTVCQWPVTANPCTPTAVYSDAAKASPIAQPLTADGQGHYGFWIAPGTYVIQATAPGAIIPSQTVTLGGSSAGTPGPAGQPGTPGTQGPPGVTPAVQIGTVTALPCGSTPTASATPLATGTGIQLNLGLPSGCSGNGTTVVAILPDTVNGNNYQLSTTSGRLQVAQTSSPSTMPAYTFQDPNGHTYLMRSTSGRLVVTQN